MIVTLLSHQWKGFWRSRGAGKSLAAQIFMGFLFTYLTAVALAIGIELRYFLTKAYPGADIVVVFTSLIGYYFSVDILFRFMLQELPVLSVQPYLAQRIRKSQLVEFLNIRSIFHFLNLIPVFLFLPFILTAVTSSKGPLAALGMTITILALTIFNHFLTLYIKRKTILNSWWYLIFAAGVAAVAALDYFSILPVRQASAWVFSHIIAGPWLAVVPVIFASAAYINNRNLLRSNLYLEEIAKKSRRRTASEYAWLKQLGLAGELIALDLKLILRNKRPRSTLFMSVVMLLYGFIFYTPKNLNGDLYAYPTFGAMFMIGVFIMNYGQFLFAWHSNYFDGLMTANIPMPVFIRSKLLLFICVSTIAFICSSFYGFISWKLIPIQLAAWLYNIGVNSVLAIYLATYSYKGIDLNKSAAFNYQGTGANQWLFALIVTLGPLLINIALGKWVHPWAGVIFLGVLGLVSTLMQGFWINFLTAQFEKRKYRILQGFREK